MLPPKAVVVVVAMEEDLAELRGRGGDLAALAAMGRKDRAELGEALKRLGFTKMGARKKVENALLNAYTPPAAAEAAPPPPAATEPQALPRRAPAPVPLAPAAPEDTDHARGTAAFREGRHADAEAHWVKAAEADPADAALWSNLSAARLVLGRAEESLQDALRAIELRPSWGKAHGRHGAALAALDCISDAISAYERGVRLAPDNATMLLELGRLKQLRAGRDAEREAG